MFSPLKYITVNQMYMKMNSQKTVIETYRGVDIFMNNEPVSNSVSITDKDGLKLNSIDKPYYSVSLGKYKNYTFQIGCYSPKSADEKTLKYVKSKIDSEIEYRSKKQLERINIHRESKHTKFIFNNVIVNAFMYGSDITIYVNDMPLRNVFVKDISLDSIKKSIHLCKRATCNVPNLTSFKKNFYKNKNTVKVNIGILPIYEFIGNTITIKNKRIDVINISHSFLDNTIMIVDIKRNQTPASIEDIESVKTMTPIQNVNILVALQNKLNFYE